MEPIGQLMKEHRVIEHMVVLSKQELEEIRQTNKTGPGFIEVAVDFFKTYADRTHHGKEEDILFRALAKKQLSAEHKKTMDELVQDHIFGRKIVQSLTSAQDSYVKGSADKLKDIISCLDELIKFYPAHIEKEDKQFFYPCLEYFSQQEQGDMLQEFWEFDRQLIHEKYQKVVDELEKEKKAPK